MLSQREAIAGISDIDLLEIKLWPTLAGNVVVTVWSDVVAT